MTATLEMLARRIESLEARNRRLEDHVENLRVRRGEGAPSPLRVDHVDHDTDGQSTRVTERDVKGQGSLDNLWKLLRNPHVAPTETIGSSKTKLAHAIAVKGEHDEGYTWGEVIHDFLPLDYGWGQLADIIGIEGPKKSVVNIRTTSRWNNANGAVGPIAFAEEPGPFTFATGPDLVLGRMVFHQDKWWPSFEEPPVVSKKTPEGSPTASPHCGNDDCRVFQPSPVDYVKLAGTQVVALGQRGTSFVNVHEIAACNRADINRIFALLDALDCHLSGVVGEIDSFLLTAFAPGANWPSAVQCIDAAATGGFCTSTFPLILYGGPFCPPVKFGNVNWKTCDGI